MTTDHMSEFLVKEYIKAFKKYPKQVIIITFLIIVFAGTAIYMEERKREKSFEELRRQNLDFSAQLTQLETTEKNLKGLLVFIQNQRNQLKESQTHVEKMKKEQEKIKPLLEADKKALESIFWAQEKRQRAKVWEERWIGFGFGFLASLIASVVWYVSAQLIKRSRDSKQEPRA